MDRILIEGLKLETIIGVHGWEREIRQTVVLDIDMGVDTTTAAKTDEIGQTVGYGDVVRAVTAFVEPSHFELIEALADAIAGLLLVEFPVAQVRLKLSKPGAVANANNVAVLIERRRP